MVRLEEVATAALQRLGRSPMEVQLMRLGSTALFRSGDGQTVVRVGGDHREMARGLQIAQALHVAGIPCVHPLVDEPVEVDGWCVTVWPLVDGGPPPSSRWLGETARALHDSTSLVTETLARHNQVLGSFIDEEAAKVRHRVADAEKAGLYDPSSLTALVDVLAEVESELASIPDETVVVHGDLYPGNVVSDANSKFLIDFDMVSLGLPGIDAAPELVRERRFPNAGASYNNWIAGYGREIADPDQLETLARLRELTMVSWIAELAVRRPSVVDEARRRIETIVTGTTEPWAAA